MFYRWLEVDDLQLTGSFYNKVQAWVQVSVIDGNFIQGQNKICWLVAAW